MAFSGDLRWETGKMEAGFTNLEGGLSATHA